MNLLYAQNVDSQIYVLTFLNGLEIARSLEVSKHMQSIIDKNESILFIERMRIEYPRMYRQYFRECPYRYDWKNIYIITDQYQVAIKRALIHKEIISNRKCFEIAEHVMIVFESLFNSLSGAFSILKLTVLGLSASRDAIRLFLKNNPEKTLQEAINAIRGTALPTQTITYDFTL